MPNRDQLRAIQAPTSIAVTAGAGTGKTHMLAHRYLHHLRQGLSPLQIVAVTYTERAAHELRTRIRDEVRAATDLNNKDAILAELEAAQISTLHALAARICRDHAEVAEVPADFTIQDELEGALLAAENLEDALETLSAEIFAVIPYSRLKSALQELLKDPLQAERALALDISRWQRLLDENRDRVRTELLSRTEWQQAGACVGSVCGKADDKLEPLRQGAVRAVAFLERSEFEAADQLFENIRINVGSEKNWPGGKETLDVVKKALKTLRELYRTARDEDLMTLRLTSVDDELARALEVLRTAFFAVRAYLNTKKAERRTLDYADLEVYAAQALDHADVQTYYGDRWQVFLVDEFQDTNPIQEALLMTLTEGRTVTIVGDERQAIYTFRGADAEVFRRFRRCILEAGGQEATLHENFRTHHALLETINTCFAPVFPEVYRPLIASRAEAPHCAPHLEAFSVSDESNSATRASRQVVEARELGLRLRALLESGTLVHDKFTGTERPVEPRDIAILSRTWRPLDVYNEVLPAMGVPTAHIGGGNLLEVREAKDVWILLRWLAEPDDDIALVALLRSPYFALSDTTLHHLLSGRSSSCWEALGKSKLAEVNHVQEILGMLAERAITHLPSRLLQLADQATGYSAVIANLPGRDRRLADYRGFLELVRTLEQGLGDVFSVTRKLRRLRLGEARVARPKLHSLDAVSLMTIHAAKGSEWPVVVVADLDYERRGGQPHTLYNPMLGVALKLDDEGGLLQEPALYKFLKRQQKMREEAELVRLLYVAFTRARDRLLLSATATKGPAFNRLADSFMAISLAFEQASYDPALATYPSLAVPYAKDNPVMSLVGSSHEVRIDCGGRQNLDSSDVAEVIGEKHVANK